MSHSNSHAILSKMLHIRGLPFEVIKFRINSHKKPPQDSYGNPNEDWEIGHQGGSFVRIDSSVAAIRAIALDKALASEAIININALVNDNDSGSRRQAH